MGALEEQARFLTAKYGTAAGPTGFAHASPAVSLDIASVMVILGLLIFAGVLYVLLRDWTTMREARRLREEIFSDKGIV